MKWLSRTPLALCVVLVACGGGLDSLTSSFGHDAGADRAASAGGSSGVDGGTQCNGGDTNCSGGSGGTGGGVGGTGGGGSCFPTPGQKFCGSQGCPSKSDPAHGCARTSCAACALSNAIADCAQDGTCGVQSCNPGFSNCDGDASTGCEVNTASDPHNCGGCGKDCFSSDGGTTNWACNQGKCEVSSCPTGEGDCNHNPADKCEVNLTTDPDNCGFCGHKCNLANANATCVGGKCTITKCKTGYTDCDKNPSNGCEQDIAKDPAHCGACGNKCSTNHAIPTCTNEQCALYCESGWADCDGNKANGCETNLVTDTNNCNACGKTCSTAVKNANVVSCLSRACTYTSCKSGWADCDGNKANGCETAVSSDVNNCGVCGKRCGVTVKHANVTCSGGSCGYSSCGPGWADCDGNKANGCETNLLTDTNSCGACGRACSSTGVVTRSCSGGTCNSTCVAGRGNCIQPASPTSDDGCETNLVIDTNNCDVCGKTCSGGMTCQSGSCRCPAGLTDCGGTCVDTQVNNGNCGGCAQPCTTPITTCSGGSCVCVTC